MADSFIVGCYDPKKPSSDQLYPLLYKTSAAAEIVLCQLHFHGTKEPRDYHLRANYLAEDMGLEEVRFVQTLKFQGGKAPSTLVPGIVPSCFEFLSFAIGWNMPLLAL